MRARPRPRLTMSERIEAINSWELEARARELLPQMAYDYYASAANDEITLRENRAAYGRITLLPRMLIDVSTRDMSTAVLLAGIGRSFQRIDNRLIWRKKGDLPRG